MFSFTFLLDLSENQLIAMREFHFPFYPKIMRISGLRTMTIDVIEMLFDIRANYKHK